jgi:ParB family chromosome partitioning protein
MKQQKLLRLSLDEIEPPQIQLRDRLDDQAIEDLANSMARVGLLNPIRVYRAGEKYRIESGHRRYLAARRLGWQFIDAIVVHEPPDTVLAKSLHENLYREDLTPMEEAALCKYLVEEQGMTLEEAARAVGHSVSWVEQRIGLTNLHPLLQEALHKGIIGVQVAQILNNVDNEDWLLVAVKEYAPKGMTARAAQEYLQQWLTVKAQLPEGAHQAPAPAWEDIREEVEKTWCDICTNRVWLRTTKLLRICFDCLKELEKAMREIEGT